MFPGRLLCVDHLTYMDLGFPPLCVGVEQGSPPWAPPKPATEQGTGLQCVLLMGKAGELQLGFRR